MSSTDEIKKLAAIHAAKYIEPDMILGIGTGSTVYWLIQEIGTRVKQGLRICCVPTSHATELLARELGIPLLALNEVESIDLTIDGADEIDHRLRLIKGGGGALLQEKMVASVSRRLVVIADGNKLVDQLGKFPLPVEVVPYGWKAVQHRIQNDCNIEASPRLKDGSLLVTDHGHHILDCHFEKIQDPESLSIKLNSIAGVVENGLFTGLADEAIIASPNGELQTILKPSRKGY